MAMKLVYNQRRHPVIFQKHEILDKDCRQLAGRAHPIEQPYCFGCSFPRSGPIAPRGVALIAIRVLFHEARQLFLSFPLVKTRSLLSQDKKIRGMPVGNPTPGRATIVQLESGWLIPVLQHTRVMLHDVDSCSGYLSHPFAKLVFCVGMISRFLSLSLVKV